MRIVALLQNTVVWFVVQLQNVPFFGSYHGVHLHLGLVIPPPALVVPWSRLGAAAPSPLANPMGVLVLHPVEFPLYLEGATHTV